MLLAVAAAPPAAPTPAATARMISGMLRSFESFSRPGLLGQRRLYHRLIWRRFTGGGGHFMACDFIDLTDRRRHLRRRHLAGSGAQAIEAVRRWDQRIVALDRDRKPVAGFNAGKRFSLLIEKVHGDRRRHIYGDFGKAQLHALFLDSAQHVKRGRFGRADIARAAAVRAALGRYLRKARPQALAR